MQLYSVRKTVETAKKFVDKISNQLLTDITTYNQAPVEELGLIAITILSC